MLDRIEKGFQFSYEALNYIRYSETTRHLLDLTSFAMGFVGLYNIGIAVHHLEDRDISKVHGVPGWQQKAFKIADLLGSLSLILSSMRSGPAIATWKWAAQVILSPEQLECFFGHQGLIPSEKLDRSLAFIAFLLSLPSTIKTFYNVYHWMTTPHLKAEEMQETEEDNNDDNFHHVSIYTQDAYLTFKVVSDTANQLLRTPHK